jgi:hypothetical protein
MLELANGFPDHVVGVIAKGQVTREDYERTLIPRVEEALTRNDKIRLYYELGPQFSGIDPSAAWEDLKVGIGHLTRWERVAVATDVEWIRFMVSAFRFLMPGEVRWFPAASASEARSWICAA